MTLFHLFNGVDVSVGWESSWFQSLEFGHVTEEERKGTKYKERGHFQWKPVVSRSSLHDYLFHFKIKLPVYFSWKAAKVLAKMLHIIFHVKCHQMQAIEQQCLLNLSLISKEIIQLLICLRFSQELIINM